MLIRSSSFTYFSTITTIDNFSPASPMLFAGCLSTWTGGQTVVSTRSGDSEIDPSVTVTVSGPVTMWGQPIEVAIQDKDVSLFTTSTSSSITSSTAQPSSTASASATSTGVSPPAQSALFPSLDDSSGLSTGAVAGIAVVAVVFGVTLLALLLWFLRSRRRGQARSRRDDFAGTQANNKPALDLSNNIYKDDPRSNVGAMVEMHSPPMELDSGLRAELPSLDLEQSPKPELSSETSQLRRHSDVSSPLDKRYSTTSMQKHPP